MKKAVIYSVVAAVTLVTSDRVSFAGITYNVQANTIEVTDFPKEKPATLAGIKEANEQNRWGKVEYDSAMDTYSINAHLQIGDGDDTTTHFQMGTQDHSTETLILAGNLRIPAPSVGGFNNVFQMGYIDDPAVTPTLKIACSTRNEFSILAKAVFKAYNSTITAATPDKEHMINEIDTFNVDWRDSHISWIGIPARGFQETTIFKRNVFSHCGTILHGLRPEITVEDCKFLNTSTAVSTIGPLRGTLYNCIFKDNDINASMRKGGRLTLVNPQLNPAKQSDIVDNHIVKGKLYKGAIIVKRYMIVEVVDKTGNPVPAALVDVTNEVPGGPVPDNGSTATDEVGLTPDRFSEPVLVTEYIQTAVEGEEGPNASRGITTRYTYQVKVSRQGFRDKIVKGIKPDVSWFDKDVTLEVVLAE